MGNTFNPDEWGKEPLGPGEIVAGIGFALCVHALAFLICFLWSLTLYDMKAAGMPAPVWVVVIAFVFTTFSAVQCIRVGIVFFTLFDEWRKTRRE
jgi:RsiW-degrading membrane proteinase PrsW (M82 family)